MLPEFKGDPPPWVGVVPGLRGICGGGVPLVNWARIARRSGVVESRPVGESASSKYAPLASERGLLMVTGLEGGEAMVGFGDDLGRP